MEMEGLFNNAELLELVEEDIEKIIGGKMDVKMGATRVLATALSALSLAGGVSTHAMKPNRNSAPGNSNGNCTPVSVLRELGEYKNTTPQVINDKELEFMCNHFNNFKIHSDRFWNDEDVGPFLAASAHAVIEYEDNCLQKFQSDLNKVFDGNYHFSEKILRQFAFYINECIEEHKPVKRRKMLLNIRVLISNFSVFVPRRNRPFRPMPLLYRDMPVILNDFPENFLNLPQVQKEFSFPSVRRNIPYDSMLAYLSDLNYMHTFVIRAQNFVNRHVQSEKGISFDDRHPQVGQLINGWYRSQTLEEARVNFYKLVEFLKSSLGPGMIDLFESFYQYVEFED